MELINKISTLFLKGDKIVSEKKDLFERFEFKSKTNLSLNIPPKENLLNELGEIPERDKWEIHITRNESDAISLYSIKLDEMDDFLSDINNDQNYFEDGDEIVFKLVIDKKFDEYSKKFSIYDFDSFISNLRGLSIGEISRLFDEYLRKNNEIIFESFEKIEPFYTSTIIFTNSSSEFEKVQKNSNRDKLIKQLNNVCHPLDEISNKYLIPEDFYLIKRSKNDELNEVFNILSFVYTLTFIYDLTSINKDNEFFFRLKGYKSFDYKCSTDELNLDSLSEFYKIYKWIHNGGNLNDKIGLARNIISLHLKKSDIFSLDTGVFSAIQSNYGIYLKENVYKYIEIKNRISDHLLEFSNKITKIVESFSDTFKRILFGIISFFISVVVITSISSNRIINIFTKDIALISYALFIISLIYLIITFKDLESKKKRYRENYNDLKSRYKDILDLNDINQIFNDDLEFNNNIKYLNSQKLRYSLLWLFSIVILFLIVKFLEH